jgi:hypothetical protein
MDGTRAYNYKYFSEGRLNHEMATSKPCKIASYKEDATCLGPLVLVAFQRMPVKLLFLKKA